MSGITAKGHGLGRHPGNYGKTYPPESLTRLEVLTLLSVNDTRRSVASCRNRALILVMYRAGLRVSEALDLLIRDVDFENFAINVRHGKGDKHRVVGVDLAALDSIKQWMNVRSAPASAPLFCTRDGKRMYASYVRGMLHRLARDAGIEKRVHPHGLRHAFAAELAREGVPPHIIQRQLGHSNLGTTTRYLATIAPQETIDWMRKRELDPTEGGNDHEDRE